MCPVSLAKIRNTSAIDPYGFTRLFIQDRTPKCYTSTRVKNREGTQTRVRHPEIAVSITKVATILSKARRISAIQYNLLGVSSGYLKSTMRDGAAVLSYGRFNLSLFKYRRRTGVLGKHSKKPMLDKLAMLLLP